MSYEMLLFPAIGWIIHRQEQALSRMNRIEKKIVEIEFLIPKRKSDKNDDVV